MIAVGAALLVVNFAGLSRNPSAINGGGSFGVLAVILSAWGVSVWTDTDANWRGAPYIYTFAGGFVVVGVVSWLIEGDRIWHLWYGLAGVVLVIRLVRIRRTRITIDSDASEG